MKSLKNNKDDINKAVNDYLYYLDFAEGRIVFKILLKNCETFFFKFYKINIWKLTNKEVFIKIFGEFKK